MIRTYTRRLTVEAEQFLVNERPWPDGVTTAEDELAWYVFVASNGTTSLIAPGDYIVTTGGVRTLVRRADFEEKYEV